MSAVLNKEISGLKIDRINIELVRFVWIDLDYK